MSSSTFLSPYKSTHNKKCLWNSSFLFMYAFLHRPYLRQHACTSVTFHGSHKCFVRLNIYFSRKTKKVDSSFSQFMSPKEVVKRFVYNKWSLDKIQHLTSTTYSRIFLGKSMQETHMNTRKREKNVLKYFGVGFKEDRNKFVHLFKYAYRMCFLVTTMDKQMSLYKVSLQFIFHHFKCLLFYSRFS